MGHELGINNSLCNNYGYGSKCDYNTSTTQVPTVQTPKIQPSFSGVPQKDKNEGSTGKKLFLVALGTAATVLLAGATHKTMNFSKIIKEAGLEKECNISKAKIFFRNLNFANWFEGSASKTLVEGYEKVGGSNKIFKSVAGDTLYLDGNKIFKVKSGDSVTLEDIGKEVSETLNKNHTTGTSASRQTSQVSNIADYPSQKVLSEISAMRGTAEENVNNIKNVFMDEMGYDSALVNVQIRDLPTGGIFNPETMSGGFNYYTGEFMLNKELMANLTKEQLAGLMRHELDHFDKSVKLCKSIGVDEYEKLFAGIDKKSLVGPDGVECKFNREFWENATKNVDTKDFDSAKYLDAFKKYIARGENQELGFYGNYLNKVSYVANPLEESAYSIQHSVEKGLNAPSLAQTYEYITPMFSKVDNELNILIKNNPALKDSKGAIFDYFYTKAIVESDPKLTSLYKQVTSSASPNEASVKEELQELMGKKMSSLQGSMFSAPDIEYEKQVFEAMADLASKGINHNEIIEAFTSKQQMLTQQLSSIFNYDQKDLIKKVLGQNSEQLLAYLDANKVDDAGTVLNLLLTKVHSENDISKMFAPRMENIKISDAVKNRIYSNEAFKEILKNNNLEATAENNEKVLASILQETSLGLF